jgi:hypothetical protein
MWQVQHGKETLATIALIQDSLVNVLVVSGRCNLTCETFSKTTTFKENSQVNVTNTKQT